MSTAALDKIKALSEQSRVHRARMQARADHEQSLVRAADAAADLVRLPAPLKIKQLQAQMRSVKKPHDAEMDRILSLPIVPELSDAEHDWFCREHILAGAYRDGFRFFRVQSQAFMEYQLFGGVLGPIAVGFGKTLISLMIANHAHTQEGVNKILLLIPPEIVAQFINDLRKARNWVPFSTPVFVLGGRTGPQRKKLVAGKRSGLYVMAYSQLSLPDAVDLLDAIKPELVIADEAQRIMRPSARTRRFNKYMRGSPKTRMVALSGTITSKSIRDYWHIAMACLREHAPIPNILEMAGGWGEIVDAGSLPGEVKGTGPLTPLITWARQHYPGTTFWPTQEGFRKAYRMRLTSAPGVVSSGEAEIACSLLLQNAPVPLMLGEGDEATEACEGALHLKTLMDLVSEEWVTPNGDEIDFAMHVWKWQFELSAGFYNELFWPSVQALAARLECSEAKAETILTKSKDYLAAENAYHSELRAFLKRGKPGLDTPMLVGAFLTRHADEPAKLRAVPPELLLLWQAKHDADFPERIDRDNRAVRVCPYKINDMVAWAKETKAGIVWVYHQEMGEWAVDALTEAGIDALHCPAGDASNKAIIEESAGKRICVASVTAHGTGKNLQHFQNQYVLQWPRPASTAEQMLGRVHRNGQTADEIVVRTCHSVFFDHANFAACLNDAFYIHDTTGNRQKLVYTAYDPLPKILPPEHLKRLGFDGVKQLNAKQQEKIKEMFG